MQLKVIQDHTLSNKKPVCDFLLMNTNLHPILHRAIWDVSWYSLIGNHIRLIQLN